MTGAPPAVTVLLFAGLRRAAGRDRLEIAVAGSLDAAACWERCCEAAPGLRSAAAPRTTLRVARNREVVGWDAQVRAGDELAFLPPVSGGAEAEGPEAAPAVHVGPEPIDVAQLAASLPTRGVGARVTFVGLVRDPDEGRAVPHLDYEAYREMAETSIRGIAQAARRRFEVVAIAVQHRTGRVLAGEPSVAVVVTAAHRRAAFEACAEVIDTLKAEAPIWKEREPGTGP